MKYDDLDPDTVAFLKQNHDTARTLTKKQVRLLCYDTETHSGNLFVAGQRINYDVGTEWRESFYVKMHDTWGDPLDPAEGPVVVHLYDPDDDSIENPSDKVLYFTTGKAAADLYLNDEALTAIWKATR